MNEGLLENGSELEVEIRGCSIEAVERIVAEVKKIMAEDKDGQTYFVNAPLVRTYKGITVFTDILPYLRIFYHIYGEISVFTEKLLHLRKTLPLLQRH